ncbi:uncharacterized protein N7511_005398 [Penicillium nucicola]|uniref:uncharacterized protein n=1 Tax=Penicillium nucicola TaxID=1850975 RepID=UPI002545AEEB|nr:uncharacterized protein N7511_005398 [Penicillium nucicola]KAJ5762016.1 hypothetical protein N7511_005398 [Penicillium nucicola]
MSSVSSVEKKRLRDRRSQQTLRDKKLRHAAVLKEQVDHCVQYHDDQGVQRLLRVISGLREQNEALIDRQTRLKTLVTSWDRDGESLPSDNRSNQTGACLYKEIGNQEPQFLQPKRDQDCHPHSTRASEQTDPFLATPTISPHTESPTESPPANKPSPWNQIPLHSDDFSRVQTIVSCPWFAYPEKIIPCPDIPSSALDILYGTKTNPLADMIHTALQRRPIRDPERLSIGWLAYHATRWIVSPSPATYERLPVFLRPMKEQLQVPHPVVLDLMPWPKLRLNLMNRWNFYYKDRDELFGMFACCVKIRWPWGEDILERNEDNELVMKPQFYETFMSERGWGITPEFIARYPDLFAGIDINSIVVELV